MSIWPRFPFSTTQVVNFLASDVASTGGTYLSSLQVLHSHVTLPLLALLVLLLLATAFLHDAEAARHDE